MSPGNPLHTPAAPQSDPRGLEPLPPSLPSTFQRLQRPPTPLGSWPASPAPVTFDSLSGIILFWGDPPIPARPDATAAAERSASIYCWGSPGTPCHSPFVGRWTSCATAAHVPPVPRAPRAAPRQLLRTGKEGAASPGARSVAVASGARLCLPPLSACPAPWSPRRCGLWGAGPERRAQLARAHGPGAPGAHWGEAELG